MEYASEMLLKAGRAGLDIREIRSRYKPRVGESKLHTFEDGWRHLRMLLIVSPHLTLLLPGLIAIAAGLVLSLLSLVSTNGLPLAGGHWLPVFLGPLLLILGAQAAMLGAIAADRSELTPAAVRARLQVFRRPDAVDVMLRRFALLALAGGLLDAALFAFWVGGQSAPSLLGLAGIAQAAIAVGIGGVMAVLSASSRTRRCGPLP